MCNKKNKKRIHLVQVIGQLKHGGAEHLVVDLCQRINKKNFKVTLLVVGEYKKSEPILINRLKESKVKVIFLGKPIGRERIKIICKLYNTLKRLKPDIVHSHLEINSIYCALISYLFKKPIYIQTIHSTKLYYKYLTRFFLNRFKITIAISDEVKKSILEKYKCKKEKIVTIYNGVDIDKFSPIGPLSNKLLSLTRDQKCFKLVIVGRLTKAKGHKILINALKLIEDKIDFVLFVIGEGELREDLLNLTKNLNLDDRIIFMGNQNDIASILRTCDIFILPSLWEGLSVALLEAVSTGIPVVATDVGSNKKVLESSRIQYKIVQPNSSEAIANGIIDIINSFDKSKKNHLSDYRDKKETYLYLNKKYSMDNFINKHEELYEILLYNH